ncbi:hypothetical protein [Streptomyces litchfieldiae]|uniref:Uncharacterized protein n=1 Tax=Streptomyces litchfieldiae TaxID=3075543 RepID=A0ABU2N261_9ACTN|nr:hypothetical protein [Streptomyces sp. DSM 44938]MDT0347697.1 hypothetical protein [Streptomyces sp. DSM 44938]
MNSSSHRSGRLVRAARRSARRGAGPLSAIAPQAIAATSQFEGVNRAGSKHSAHHDRWRDQAATNDFGRRNRTGQQHVPDTTGTAGRIPLEALVKTTRPSRTTTAGDDAVSPDGRRAAFSPDVARRSWISAISSARRSRTTA